MIAALVACSGKPRPEAASHGGATPGDAGGSAGAMVGSGSAGDQPRGTTGDLQIHVAWPDVPVAARSSPGRTPCGTPRTPSVAPTTTWGVPDALVIVDGAGGPPPVAHVTLADCTLAPRIAAGSSIAITSAVDHPARLVLRKRGPASDLAHLTDGAPLPVLLPIAGHTVVAALDAGAIYSLETAAPAASQPGQAGAASTDAGAAELAFFVAYPGSYITDASGQVTAAGLTAGKHAVTAWLPPRAGQPARLGHGTTTVVAGELAELTVALTP
ncbi:MAG TPA: hypothetical protein VH165_20770 [Kofleriaceae bacterium]|jgi:hypothetical protein|nr:hypothetical protein [Kofleriaceae bacterium]